MGNKKNQNWPAIPLIVMLASTVAGCGGGSGNNQSADNAPPSIQLNDGDVLGNGNSIVRIPASDDTGITSVSAVLLRQGKLAACEGRIDLALTSDSLLDACLTDQPTCSVDFIPSSDSIAVYPPPLYAPIGLEYEVSVIDRNGAITDPKQATFCFDVGVNTPPVAAADTYQLVFPGVIQTNGVTYNARCEKLAGSDGVLFNDDDDEHITNSCLRAELLEPPQFATNVATFGSTFSANGGFRYEGLTSAQSPDSFTYRVTDGINPPSLPIKVDIIYSGVNRPPIAVDDEFTVPEDSGSQALSVLNNDDDPDGLPLTVTQINNGPTAGIATIRNGVIIDYRPNADYNGNDSFEYVTTDSANATATATVRIQVTAVNDLPSATNDEVVTNENSAIRIDVVANDTDPDGDNISVTSVTSPANGSSNIQDDGQVLYTPQPGFTGTDDFVYEITDSNGAADTANVSITVLSVNLPPVAIDDEITTEQDDPVSFSPLDNDSDPDGDVISITSVNTPANGSASIRPNNRVIYTPDPGFSGNDQFEYQINDNNGAFATAIVTIIVTGSSQPPVAQDDSVNTTLDTSATINPLANDSDPDGDTLTVTSVTTPANGSVIIQDDGQLLYTPDEGFAGADEFEYEISDASGSTDSAVVTVTVAGDNLPPVAQDDVVVTELDDPVSFRPLQNDSDPDGNDIEIVSVTQPDSGTTAFNAEQIIFRPVAGYIGTDTFEYTISDGEGGVATATVTITVTPL